MEKKRYFNWLTNTFAAVLRYEKWVWWCESTNETKWLNNSIVIHSVGQSFVLQSHLNIVHSFQVFSDKSISSDLTAVTVCLKLQLHTSELPATSNPPGTLLCAQLIFSSHRTFFSPFYCWNITSAFRRRVVRN